MVFPKNYDSHAAGFTLIELMVTVTVLALLTTVGLPSLQKMVERSATNEQANTLLQSITLARTEAIKRNAAVTLCSSTSAESGTPSCANQPDWGSGWLVFLDRNDDGDFSADEADVLIRAQGSFPQGASMKQNGSVNHLIFRATGILHSGRSTFTILAASGNPQSARCLIISSTGRTRLTDAINGGC